MNLCVHWKNTKFWERRGSGKPLSEPRDPGRETFCMSQINTMESEALCPTSDSARGQSVSSKWEKYPQKKYPLLDFLLEKKRCFATDASKTQETKGLQ